MIKKIKKIKNLGLVFSNYRWDSSLPDFARYNIVYGWNRSGKTTLSNLFSALETGQLKGKENLEYEISTEEKSFKEKESFESKIRVFNQHYIAENIELSGCTAKPVYILGEENKIILKQIENDEKLLNGDPHNPNFTGKIKQLKDMKSLKENKERERGLKFTDVAKLIGENASGVTARTYRKPDAEKSFGRIKQKMLLNQEEKKKCLIDIQQEQKPLIDVLALPSIGEGVEKQDVLEFLDKVVGSSVLLCSKTVEAVVIDRLKDNSDISGWVEAGLNLHKKHESKTCEFCGQNLLESRLNELAGFFNAADQELKNDIDNILQNLHDVYSQIDKIGAVDKANLYKDLQVDYQTSVTNFNEQKRELLGKITDLENQLKSKKSKTTESVNLGIDINKSDFTGKLEVVNADIKRHNAKTNNFQEEKEKAQIKLENHYLSDIYDDVKKLDGSIDDCVEKIDIIEKGDPKNVEEVGIAFLEERIRKNRAIISSSHKACEKINDKLNTFLGSDEIRFEVVKEGGYIIKRNGEIAHDLSEGEKTAIAFVHFIIHLQDKDFDIKNGIVVIDDPISSLDSNSLFQAFAFLKNSVKDAQQIFIFTHNFDFLRLLLNWLKHIKKSLGLKSYYMIKNKTSSCGREAYLSKLDDVLKDNESEYHYLFKILTEFETDGTIASVYHIPNIARKVLDTFLMFRVPNNSATYEKLEQLDFDEDKKIAIYKFVNDQSHITGKGFDPSLVPETQKNVKYLLEMMESAFPEHFKIIKESLIPSV